MTTSKHIILFAGFLVVLPIGAMELSIEKEDITMNFLEKCIKQGNDEKFIAAINKLLGMNHPLAEAAKLNEKGVACLRKLQELTQIEIKENLEKAETAENRNGDIIKNIAGALFYGAGIYLTAKGVRCYWGLLCNEAKFEHYGSCIQDSRCCATRRGNLDLPSGKLMSYVKNCKLSEGFDSDFYLITLFAGIYSVKSFFDSCKNLYRISTTPTPLTQWKKLDNINAKLDKVLKDAEVTIVMPNQLSNVPQPNEEPKKVEKKEEPCLHPTTEELFGTK